MQLPMQSQSTSHARSEQPALVPLYCCSITMPRYLDHFQEYLSLSRLHALVHHGGAPSVSVRGMTPAPQNQPRAQCCAVRM
jgi:hypothetical protein